MYFAMLSCSHALIERSISHQKSFSSYWNKFGGNIFDTEGEIGNNFISPYPLFLKVSSILVLLIVITNLHQQKNKF